MEIKKPLYIVLPLILLLSGLFFIFGYSKRTKFGPINLSVTSIYDTASVFVSDALVGSTPFKGQIKELGDVFISVKGEFNTYDTKINASPGTEIAIKRDLGVSSNFSSGQDIWMEKVSKGDTLLTAVSNVSGIKVLVDNVEVGETPLTLSDVKIIEPDKDHKLDFVKDGFEGQTINVKTRKGYKVNISVDMFLLPIFSNDPDIPLLSQSTDSLKIYGVNAPEVLAANISPKIWASGITYYKNTRGRGVPEFDYYVDEDGLVYLPTGQELDLNSFEGFGSSTVVIGYLSKDREVLSEKAASSLGALTLGTVSSSGSTREKTAQVLETGTDFGLNVRSGPGVSNEKVGTVDVGATVTILEEGSGWAKIKLASGIEGWVSSTYLKITEPETQVE